MAENVEVLWLFGIFSLMLAATIAHILWARLEGEAATAVASIYRAALRQADAMGEQGLEWLKSPEGIARRKELVNVFYCALPPGPITAALRLFLPDQFWQWLVQEAFERIARLADELPPEAE